MRWVTFPGMAEWCDCLNTPEQRADQHRLIDARNLTLARRVAAIHDAGHSVFAAVGSLHLTGPQGMPALLQAQGFRIELVLPSGG